MRKTRKKEEKINIVEQEVEKINKNEDGFEEDEE